MTQTFRKLRKRPNSLPISQANFSFRHVPRTPDRRTRPGFYPVHGVKPHCYELKCYTPFHVSPALGLGSTDKAQGRRRLHGRMAGASRWATLRKPSSSPIARSARKGREGRWPLAARHGHPERVRRGYEHGASGAQLSPSGGHRGPSEGGQAWPQIAQLHQSVFTGWTCEIRPRRT